MPQNENLQMLLRRAEDNHLYRTQPETVVDAATSALHLSRMTQDRHSEARSLVQLASYWLERTNYQKALQLYTVSLSIFQEQHDQYSQAIALRYIGICYTLCEQFGKAFQSLMEAWTLFRTLDCSVLAAQTLHNLCHLTYLQGDLEKSVQFGIECLEVTTNEFNRILPFTLFHIGNIHWHLRDYEEADRFFHEAHGVLQKDTEVGTSFTSLDHISPFDLKLFADIEHRCGNYSGAQQLYEQALPSFHAHGFLFSYTECLNALATIEAQKGNHSTALSLLQSSLRQAEKIDNQNLLSSTQFHYGQCLLRMEQLPKAIDMISSAVSLLPTDSIEQLYFLETLADAYEKNKEYQAAVRCYRATKTLVENKSRIRAQRRLALLPPVQPPTSIVIQEHVSELGSERLKNDVRTTQALLIQLRHDLKTVIADDASSVDLTLNSIISSLDQHLDRTEARKNVAAQLEDLDKEFLLQLASSFPELSTTERKVCSLIRLGFTTNQIKDILFVSTRTVENHRLHIRKKLSIPAKTALDEFLLSL